MHNLKIVLLSSRPVSWVNTAYPFAAGYIMLTRHFDSTLLIGTLFYLFPYNLLMYGVNDVYDYESDLKNPRKGGIEGLKLQKSKHRLVLLSAYLLAAPFIAYLPVVSHKPYGAIILLANIFLVLAYSLPRLRFKERAFVDSLTSSSHFVGPLIFAASFAAMKPSLIIIGIAFFLWGMASHAFGAVQDITSDKQAGIGSIATIIGGRATVRLSIVLYASAAVLLAFYGWISLIIAIVIAGYIINIWPFRNIKESDAEQTNVAWKKFIKLNQFAGFIITLVLIYLYKH